MSSPQEFLEKLNRTRADLERRFSNLGESVEGNISRKQHLRKPMSGRFLPHRWIPPSGSKLEEKGTSVRPQSENAHAEEDAELALMLSKYEERIRTLEEEKKSLTERLASRDSELQSTRGLGADMRRLQSENGELRKKLDWMQRRRLSSARFWGAWAGIYRRQKKLLDRRLKREEEAMQKTIQISDQLVRAQERIAFLENPPKPDVDPS